MSFIKRDIKDRVVQYPRRYQLVEVQPGIFDLIPVTGTVTEEGTPVNKELLQRYEDGLDAALEKTGDGKDVIVTFTEAATEAHIASGEKLSIMFGKILKMFKGKAPNSHASSATTYGVGTTANYGHVKTINGLTQSSHVDGTALSAYQGKVLKDLLDTKITPNFVKYEGNVTPNKTVTIATFNMTEHTKIFLDATRDAYYSIASNNLIFGIRDGESVGNQSLVSYVLSSTPIDVTYRSTSNVNHYGFTLRVSGNTATLRLVSNSSATGEYTVILF